MTHNLPSHNKCTIAVIGLGYVGLPLALEFARNKICYRTKVAINRQVIGFDINIQRLEELRNGRDRTNETTKDELNEARQLEFTNDLNMLSKADVFVVTVPTPIDSTKRPDLGPLVSASKMVGDALRNRNAKSSPLIIYESTVYPGATEEICVPILENKSGLTFNQGFYCGYSPERINPGDREHRLTTITKVTSGSTIEAAEWIDKFYGSIISAGTHLAPSIKVAEAAKVIENTQRDLNIALVNELAIIFKRMDIDTLDVLEAAGTKWNFLPFRPGLVGGHCIGVDPYYLTHKAQQLGYHPEIVLAGRRINDGMGDWVVEQLVKALVKKGKVICDLRVLILGVSFKENCPDLRNTRVIDLIHGLEDYGMLVEAIDPWVDPDEALNQYNVTVKKEIPENSHYGVVIVAVAHREFLELTSNDWTFLLDPNGVILDFKGVLPRSLNAIRI